MKQKDNLLQNVYIKAIFPNMIAILGGTINVFVDGILIGRKMGDVGIAAVNQSLAVYLILCTIGSLFAAGASAESAFALGQREEEKAKEYFGIAVETAFTISLIFCSIGFLLSPMIAGILGSDVTKKLIETYIRITFVGGVFKVMLYIPYYYMRLVGKMKQAATAMTMMTVMNIVLDYLFLFPMNMGIAGAALASVIATMIVCGICFYSLCAGESIFKLHFVKLNFNRLKSIFVSGSPMAANNLFSTIRILVLNFIMNLAGGSSLVTVFAITNNLNEFSICVQNGIPQTGSALLGVYYGENDNQALKGLLALQIKSGIVISAIVAGMIALFSGQIGLLFGSYLNVKTAVLCWTISLLFATCNNVMNYYYYSIKQASMANLITILRVFAVTCIVAWCLKDKGEAIWLFYPLSEVLTFVIWVVYGKWYARKLGKSSLLFLGQEEGASIHLTVSCDVEEICKVSAGIQDFGEKNDLDMQQTMILSLAVEELLLITAEKILEQDQTMDLRVLKTKEGAILRIRSEGKAFNPLEQAADNLEYMGVGMIMKMATRTQYQSTLGLNTLIVEI